MTGVRMRPEDRSLLQRLFRAAVAAAEPEAALRPHLPERPRGRCVVLGFGKGVVPLARAFLRLWDAPCEGVVVTRHGEGGDCGPLRVIEAAHPVPDEAGLRASGALMGAVQGLTEDDLVVVLACGGGSALLPCPPGGLTLEDEAALNRALLASGAPIAVMNAIRRQVSGIKGGRLARAAHPARVVTFVVSDVPGDDPAAVASGPTVPAPGTREEARHLAALWGVDLPPRVAAWLAGREGLPPLPSDPAFARDSVRVIASARLSLEAAARAAAAEGVTAAILSDAMEGEAREAGRVLAAITREVALRNRPFARPVLLLSGGETTVTLRGSPGAGGRNTEFALALALAANGVDFAALAADTDGIDGTGPQAGAFVDGGTAARLRAQGIDGMERLMAHDSAGALGALGDLFETGPTGTNVNDFRAILLR
ncbi:Putative glycerate kinase [Rubellimicrobium thermophilum DSM 16684]|uniref:Putative glycerate kinase n=2 Tax=Rubellimicrobium TaxID=295418 RepID=S9QUQ8_9RHOB|nr:Putative glycerate kinase [Rubellimicrobium thermophilum DSM 16684]